MSSGGTLQLQGQALMLRVKSLTNDNLRKVCRDSGLQVSGTKAPLQQRINAHIDHLVRSQATTQFDAIQTRIYSLSGGRPPPAPPATNHATMYASTNGSAGSHQFANTGHRSQMNFKRNPFFDTKKLLAPPLRLGVVQNGKAQESLTFALDQDTVNDLRTDRDWRVMIYGGSESAISPYSSADISFPVHLEVRINDVDITKSHNWKGIKNKPGTTKPADITSEIRRNTVDKNKLTVTYAYTDKESAQKRHYFEVHLVKRMRIEALIETIKARAHFSKERVIQDMLRKADDPDIVATSSVMSLKDPVSCSRIKLPCRSQVCQHNGCFDAESFLSLQEQAPTWTCPLCNRAVTFESLNVDKYFQEILEQTSSSTEQVTIEPDGRWSAGANNNGTTNGKGAAPNWDDDSDDDIVEVTGIGRSFIKEEPDRNGGNSFLTSATPPITARPSLNSDVQRSGAAGTKRKSDVIDLTLDSDDEQPPPPKKIQYGTPNGHTDPYGRTSNGYPTNNAAHSRPSVSTNGNTFPHHRYPQAQSQLPHSSSSTSSTTLRFPPMRTSNDYAYPPNSHGSSNSSGSYHNAHEYR